MEFLLKTLGPKALLSLLPYICIRVGNYFKGKDANTTGTDDAGGNLLIALAPALDALDDNNESAFRKALLTVYTTIGNYLKLPPPE